MSSQKFGFGFFTIQISKEEEVNFCIKYYPTLFNITSNKSEAVSYSLNQIVYLEEDADTCQNENIPEDLSNKIALIPTQNKTINGNCTIKERAETIIEHNGYGMIADQPLTSKFNASDYTGKILVVALKKSSDVDEILKLQKDHTGATFYMYSPEIEKLFDFSLLVILAMAIFTVSVGSMWSGYTKKRLLDQKSSMKRMREQSTEGEENEDREQIYADKESNHANREEISLQVTPVLIIGFVFCMCMMLLMLYFFFDKLGKWLVKSIALNWNTVEKFYNMKTRYFG